jgi:hypothetical protein
MKFRMLVGSFGYDYGRLYVMEGFLFILMNGHWYWRLIVGEPWLIDRLEIVMMMIGTLWNLRGCFDKLPG